MPEGQQESSLRPRFQGPILRDVDSVNVAGPGNMNFNEPPGDAVVDAAGPKITI